MDYLLNLDKNPSASHEDRRKHPRKECSIKANYMVQGHWHRGSIENISEGGAYILALEDKTFSPGEGIFLIAHGRVLLEQLRGKIAWVGPYGVGIEFQTAKCV